MLFYLFLFTEYLVHRLSINVYKLIHVASEALFKSLSQ